MKKDATHWRDRKERASGVWQMDFMLGTYRLLGAKGLRFVVYPLVFFFCLFAPGVVSLSRSYLSRVARFHGTEKPRWRDSYWHVVSFAFSMFEKMAAWSGDVRLESIRFHDDGVGELIALLETGKGAVVVCSHMGNVEILRALASRGSTKVSRDFRVTSIVDFSGTARFNALIKRINPDSMMRLVNARDIGVDTVIDLQARLASGELLVIAGDRTSSTARDKVEAVSFLGEPASFPQGAFILASVMDAPVFFMFGLRERDLEIGRIYDMHVTRANTEFAGSRKERKEKIRAIIGEYVALIERHSAEHPLQWYNFYDFWGEFNKGDA